MNKVDFGIIGAGPTGLYLGIRLLQEGYSVQLWEKQSQVSTHSRSIGIHPPSLELFERHGFVEPFLKLGNKVLGGEVFSDGLLLGNLAFESCKPPFPFVLSLPQQKTEELLETTLLNQTNETVLFRSAEIRSIQNETQLIRIQWVHEQNDKESQCTYLIDASGKHSVFRSPLGFSFSVFPYPDSYVMGDFKREEQPESFARIYLDSTGVIESFPLPNSMQRWVLKTAHFDEIQSAEALANRLKWRTGELINLESNSMFSIFGVQKGIADKLLHKNVILCGDSAHIFSPIGGQGMNLAWLNAETLIQSLKRNTLSDYDQVARKRWNTVVKRSEFNMIAGRTSSPIFNKLKQWGVKIGLSPIARTYFANQFTMRGLNNEIHHQ